MKNTCRRIPGVLEIESDDYKVRLEAKKRDVWSYIAQPPPHRGQVTAFSSEISPSGKINLHLFSHYGGFSDPKENGLERVTVFDAWKNWRFVEGIMKHFQHDIEDLLMFFDGSNAPPISLRQCQAMGKAQREAGRTARGDA